MIWLVDQLSKLFSLEDALNRLILLRLTFRILNLSTKSTVGTKMSSTAFTVVSLSALTFPGWLQRLASGRGRSGTACQG